MRPLPETHEALLQMAAGGDTSTGVHLFALARRVQQVVPNLVGVSLTLIEEGITLTVIASDEEAAALDAVQYLDDGPCETAVREGRVVEAVVDGLLDEGRWLLYAQASAASGIASSLSLPIMVEGHTIGGINLYGSAPDAFRGRHEEVARAVGSTAQEIIANADLAFRTAEAAKSAPETLRANHDINIALGIIAESQGVSIPMAHDRLRETAARAGITETEAARAFRNPKS